MGEPVLCSYEINLLRSMDGEAVSGLQWGAAMSEAIGFLLGRGLVRQEFRDGTVKYVITKAGKQFLKDRVEAFMEARHD